MAMETTQMARRFVITSLLALLAPIVLFAPQAYAESYVAGQIGFVEPQDLSNGEVTQAQISGLSISDQPMQNTFSLGGKFGHFFTKARWIGIETGVFYSTPDIKEGSLVFSGPGGSLTSPILASVHQRMITWDNSIIFRYPRFRLQPYIGIGPSVYFASLNGPDAPPGQSATAFGFNAEIGLRYYITRSWALFGEGKYNYARINYSSNDSDPNADPFAFRATYTPLTFSLGVSYHF
jgi:opacity protein-like surface antigen